MVGDGPSYYKGDSSPRSTWMFFTTIKRDITKDLAESTETFWCVPPYPPILCVCPVLLSYIDYGYHPIDFSAVQKGA